MNLIEPNFKYIIKKNLKNSKIIKEKYHYFYFNLYLSIILISFLILILIYKYKGKLTEEEIKKKNMNNKKYIISKINLVNNHNKNTLIRNNNKNMITDLPLFEDNPILSTYK